MESGIIFALDWHIPFNGGKFGLEVITVRSYFRVEGAAQYAAVSERTIRNWIAQGLQYSKIGGVVLIRREHIDQFIEAHMAEQKGEEADQLAREVLARL